MLESFVKQFFSAEDTPGTQQVQNGAYFVSLSNHDNKALTKTNWSSVVYPGAKLAMTVILSMLKMPVGRCPKPSCGYQVPDATELGAFLTCQACGLQFRFNPDIKRLGLKAEDDKLQLMHQDQDLSNFGRRHIPRDMTNVQDEDERLGEEKSPCVSISSAADTEPKEPTAQSLTTGNLVALETSSSQELSNGTLQIWTSDSPQLPSVDWNSGSSGMVAWLNSSAAPLHESEHPDLLTNAFRAEAEQLQQEQKDIESLRRVHFVSAVPESQSLTNIVKDYQDLPLDAQIYVRKIVDRFPKIPSFLAKRFGNANARRQRRLQQLKTLGLSEYCEDRRGVKAESESRDSWLDDTSP
ncbi:MAG: hypothetical protein Q9167_007564 [Letrouitia subvulpina]